MLLERASTNRSRMTPRLAACCAALAAVLLLAGVASACPTCKDNLAHDPATANLARGFYYSILFMVSMPFLIFGGMSAYFYWEVRKARARQLAEQAVAASGGAELAEPKLAL
jgi:heme/copper-type cytochrome/quinol oxidase subunit 2